MVCPRNLMPERGVFHVIGRSNNKLLIFVDDVDFQKIYDLIFFYKNKYPFDVYHYSIMPTHIHMEVYIANMPLFSKMIHDVKLAYYYYFKSKYGYVGHLWNGPFKSIPIESEGYLLRCGRYIELNPFKAGLVKDIGQYKWNSYLHYAMGTNDLIVTTSPWFIGMGSNKRERRENYIKFIKEGMWVDWKIEGKIFEDLKHGRPSNSKKGSLPFF